MTPRRHRRPVLAIAAVVLSGLAVLPAGAAHADRASDAPVTAADEVDVRGGQFGSITTLDVLANDSDPNGDELAICRLDVPAGARISVERISADSAIASPVAGPKDEPSGEQLLIVAGGNRSRTVTFTYWACDFDYLTPATVTVNVEVTPRVVGTKVAGKPGRVKFSNPGDRRVVVLYGGPRQERADGRIRLAPGASQVVRVKRHTIVFVAFTRRGGDIDDIVNVGRIRGIRLPGRGNGDPLQPATGRGVDNPADLRVWRATR